MRTENAIEIVNMTKRFKKVTVRHGTIKTMFVDFARRGFRPQPRTLVTVLENLSLNIKKGMTFGIMGKNGAGKSTLLKLIAGIISPSSGQIRTYGSITPLLELGAGFHPDLTGKENILINGLILGLKKREIEKKYDEIMDFAELRDVMDEPVRTYSSGMYSRLAFSVAINIDPDIILLDEILSVGDASFQIKSKQKIHEFKKRGKTIVFVSHSPGSVEEICDEAAFLQNGRVASSGKVENAVLLYNGLSKN